MFARTASVFLALGALVLPLAAQTRQLLVFPPGDGSRNVAILQPESLNQIATVQAATDSYAAFIQPGAPGKMYIVGRSSSNTITVVSAANQLVTTINLPNGTSDAAMTTDGRRLLVISSQAAQLTIIDTASDAVTLTLPLPAPGLSLVTNFDSTRAFVLSQQGAVVTAFDLTTFQQVGTLSLASEVTQLSSLSFGPNGLLYATTVNRLWEIDPRTLQLTKPLGLPFTGNPGSRAFITPDGTRAIMTNATPTQGSSVILFDLSGTAPPQGLFLSGLLFNNLRLISNNSALAFSPSGGQFYQITWNPLTSNTLSIAGLPPITTQPLRGFAVTTEFPNSRTGYVGLENAIYRFDAATNTVLNQTALAGLAGTVALVRQPSSNPPATMQGINVSQFVLPGATSLPLVTRVLDQEGNPIAGVRVNYTTNQSNAVLSTAQAITNSEGYAQAFVTAPNQNLNFLVTAAIDGNFTQIFTILVNSSGIPGGGGGTGTVSVAGGNGQLVQSRTSTLRPMQVRVRDAQGNPVVGALVAWTITNGGGTLSASESTTDGNGIASNNFIGNLLLSTLSSFATSTIAASTPLGTVNFTMITIPERADNDPFRPSGRPIIQQVAPNPGVVEISGPLGTTLRGAFQFRILAGGGPLLLQPIPGVGIQAVSDGDPATGPQVECQSDAQSDNTGTVTCDLRLFNRTGVANVVVTIGGLENFSFQVTITPGAPGRVTALQGNNQRGVAGRQLAQALVARVDDGFGNILNGVDVTWRVVSGNVRLVQTVSRSSNGLVINAQGQGELSSGLVSTGVVLGNTPGEARIRAQISNTIFAEFTVTTDVSFGAFTRVSGDGQSAAQNQAFADPLVVRITDQNQAPLAGATISFATTGDLRLSSATATTDAQGLARINVTAGPTAGSFTVSATVSGSNLAPVTFNLTVRPPGPNITSIVNGAGGADSGVAPCGIATINGNNLAPGITGTLSGQSLLGTLALTLNNTTVTFGGVTAPIASISNIAGVESISVQVPCEAGLGSLPVAVRTGQVTGTANVTVRPTAPGIFETLEGSLRYAVAQRPNGSFVSPSNPALRGETIRLTVSNLGQTSPTAITNVVGTPGQRATADLLIGLNNEGVDILSAEYSVGQNGLYVITFTIPMNSPTGSRPIVVAGTGSDGNTVYSNNSVIEIR